MDEHDTKHNLSSDFIEGWIREEQQAQGRGRTEQSTPIKRRESRAQMTCFSDVQPQLIDWLWPQRIAAGKLTIIAGDPGLGKSLITAFLAAAVSRGFQWPHSQSKAPCGGVILLSAEDDPADTIRPRLDAANADCSRIYFLGAIHDERSGNTRMFSLKKDIAVLEDVLAKLPECKLLIVDPISAYLDGTDSHNNSDVRGLLAPLSALAERYDVAVVVVHHLNKNTGAGNALYRTMGSLAFTAAARAAYIVTKGKDNPARRLIIPTKNNIAKESDGLAYTITEAQNGAPVIAWEAEPVSITADEALALPVPNAGRTISDEAEDFLRLVLASGSMLALEVQKEARAAGISEKPLRNARARLGIKTTKTSFDGAWQWSLPQRQEAQIPEDAHPSVGGVLETEGHLGESETVEEQV